MKTFKTLVLDILNESPVGVNSKEQWVASIVHRLVLNRQDTPTNIHSKYSEMHAGEFKDVLPKSRYYYDDFAEKLSHKIDNAIISLTTAQKLQPTVEFVLTNSVEIVKTAGYDPSTTLGSRIESDLQDAVAGRSPNSEAIIAGSIFTPLVVELIVDKMFDDVFVPHSVDIEDYHASRGVEDRKGMSGEYPHANASNTDKEWDRDILLTLKKVLPAVAKELKIRYTPKTNELNYTARITAQSQEAIAYNFPMQRTGMGRGSGGDKRAGEEIMSISANKREMVARASAAIEDDEVFNTYDYVFNFDSVQLEDYDKELLERLHEALPQRDTNRYTSTELKQSGIRSGVFRVPALVRAFIKKLVNAGIVTPQPVVKKDSAGRSAIDLFDL